MYFNIDDISSRIAEPLPTVKNSEKTVEYFEELLKTYKAEIEKANKQSSLSLFIAITSTILTLLTLIATICGILVTKGLL